MEVVTIVMTVAIREDRPRRRYERPSVWLRYDLWQVRDDLLNGRCYSISERVPRSHPFRVVEDVLDEFGFDDSVQGFGPFGTRMTLYVALSGSETPNRAFTA